VDLDLIVPCPGGHDHCCGEWQAPSKMSAHGRGMAEFRHEEAVGMDVGSLLMKASDNLSVRRAFGTAYEKDDVLIIPVAVVAGGGGAGTGHPRHRDPGASPDIQPEGSPSVDDATRQDSGRVDTGGGFGGLVLPLGAYVVKGDQVRWVSAVDMTIAVLASLSLVRVLSRTWTRSRQHQGPL
jgi:uncharacterized spore protein YtfJ